LRRELGALPRGHGLAATPLSGRPVPSEGGYSSAILTEQTLYLRAARRWPRSRACKGPLQLRVRAPEREGIVGKITASMCVLALVLFLFPWLTVSCNDQKVASQSGCQAMYGGYSPSSDMKKMGQTFGGGGGNGQKGASEEKPGGSILTILAFLAVLGSAVIAVAAEVTSLPVKLSPGLERIIGSIRRFPVKVGLLTGIALGLLLFTWIVGFPIVHKVKEAQGNAGKQADSNMPMEVSFGVSYNAWFYLELLALVPPTFLMLNDKYKWVALGGTTAKPPAPTPPSDEATPPAEAEPSGGETEEPPS